MGMWLKERILILLWFNGRDGFEEEGFSFGKLIGIPMTCPATWFFISQTSTGVPQCSLLSEIEEVLLPKVDQPLGNVRVFKGIKIVGDSQLLVEWVIHGVINNKKGTDKKSLKISFMKDCQERYSLWWKYQIIKDTRTKM